jgi:hypothetical protein
LIQTAKNPEKTSILGKYEDDPDIPVSRNPKTLESWPGWFR